MLGQTCTGLDPDPILRDHPAQLDIDAGTEERANRERGPGRKSQMTNIEVQLQSHADYVDANAHFQRPIRRAPCFLAFLRMVVQPGEELRVKRRGVPGVPYKPLELLLDFYPVQLLFRLYDP